LNPRKPPGTKSIFMISKKPLEPATAVMARRSGAISESAETLGVDGSVLERYVVIAAAIGALLRILQYLGNRSLWLDEALLFHSMNAASWSQVLDPTWMSPTPRGFIAAQKLATLLAGEYELILRFLPLVGGLSSIVLFVAVARRALSRTARPVAVALFAFSPFLIYYTSELKQYSTDVAAALAITMCALWIRDEPTRTARYTVLALLGPLLFGLSLTAVFVIAGSALVLAVSSWSRGRHASAILAVTAAVPTGVLFALPFLRSSVAPGSETVEGASYMSTFWHSGFMPLPPRTWDDLLWFPHTALRVFQDPLGLIHNSSAPVGIALAVAGLIAFGAGCRHLLKRDPVTLALLLAPIVLTLIASGLQRYPFGADWNTGGRVILFLVPFFLLLVAEGAISIAHGFPRRAQVLGWAFVGILVVPGAAQAITSVPYGRGELKPLLSHVQENWRDGDVLYVHYDALPAFLYYADRYGFSPGEYVEGVCARFEPHQYLWAIDRLRGLPRVWVLFTAGVGAELFNERRLMVEYFEHIGTRLDDRVARGTSLYLFDLNRQSASTGEFRAKLPVFQERLEDGCALWQ
jgi:hypothetical protein